MSNPLTLEEIRAHWTRQAKLHGQSPAASWSDHRVIEMEIRQMADRLADGDRVLDIGCANGFSTLQLGALRTLEIKGVDYVPDMIEQARLAVASWEDGARSRFEFAVDDIMSLKEPSEAYDKAVVIRVVINLGDWSRQKAGLLEAARVVKPGGLLLLSEATQQGWRRLNGLRTEWGLPEIPVPGFNNYLDEQRTVEALAPVMDLVEIADFASTYYVATRVLKPLLIQALGLPISAADPDAEWNRFFSLAPAWGDYGTQKLFVFRKRA
jgi:ubiquinone/menaquinone biosynthesis C-methylase UbiE